jgi:hypothetical protein
MGVNSTAVERTSARVWISAVRLDHWNEQRASFADLHCVSPNLPFALQPDTTLLCPSIELSLRQNLTQTCQAQFSGDWTSVNRDIWKGLPRRMAMTKRVSVICATAVPAMGKATHQATGTDPVISFPPNTFARGRAWASANRLLPSRRDW